MRTLVFFIVTVVVLSIAGLFAWTLRPSTETTETETIPEETQEVSEQTETPDEFDDNLDAAFAELDAFEGSSR